MNTPIARFLLAGGVAAATNWFARMAFSTFLPLSLAIIAAYAIGMALGFILYRRYVFAAGSGELMRQVPAFLVVNLVGAGIVLATTILLLALFEAASPSLQTALKESIAHGLAIAVGAVANYLGHKLVTFSSHGVATPGEGRQAIRRI